MRLIRIGEDYRKLKLKIIWTQIGLKRLRIVWEKKVSVDDRSQKSNCDCLALIEPILFKRGIYQGDTLYPLGASCLSQ